MKNLSFLVLLLALYSCSSPEKKEANESEPVSTGKWISEDPELTGLVNEDFTPRKPIKYRPSLDNFDGPQSMSDALAKESLARLPNPELDGVVQTEDPINQILAHCYQREFDASFKLIEKVYRQERTHPAYLTAIGTCWYLKGQNKKALLFYNKAREIDSKYAPVYNNMGVIYQQEGKDQKAMLAYEKALEFNSFSKTPNFNLAQMYLKYGLVDKALPLFEGLHDENAQDSDVLAGLANCAFLKGQTDQALEYFQMIDPADIRKPHIAINYALALRIKGRNPEALDIFKKIDRKKTGNLSRYYKKVSEFLGVQI